MEAQPRAYKPHPWPWGQPSVLNPEEETPDSWLDIDFEEEDDSEDYVPESDETNSEESESDSDSNDGDISDSEPAALSAHAYEWRCSPSFTKSQKVQDEREDLPHQIARLVKAEQDAAAAYNPDDIVSLITQLYELLIDMGHWPEGSLRYPPHTDPPVNDELAVQLGYAPAAISLMQRLPYLAPGPNYDEESYIIGRTRCADYTSDDDVREGRRPYPYQYLLGCPDLDPWLLPFMLPERDGWHVMLDTRLGVVRAYNCERSPRDDTVESRRHGFDLDTADTESEWTEYRRAPLVPAAHYFSELIYAYRSLSRLPVMDADRNDPRETRYRTSPAWRVNQEKEEMQTLLALYSECGWPNRWRRAEFVSKWDVARRDIEARAQQAMNDAAGEHHI
ncbi:hypothetical protein B0H11DRAFT_833178 [Mycena galericulata]|nr:hypothetical protein B0H11DRAFT_833178 [Mycena galericulata]